MSDLYFRRMGSGVPVLCMHGGLGLDHTTFLPWLEPLAGQAELVLYDHRGNGRSPALGDGSAWEVWVEDADALIDEPFILLGHSYGSFLAQAYALAHPERLRGLVLVSSAPALDHIGEALAIAQARGTPDQFAALAEGFSAPAADDASFRALWNQVLPIYFHRFDPEVAAEMDRRCTYSAEGFNRGQAHLQGFDHRGRLGSISAPTLLIAGASDWVAPPRLGADRMAAEIPDARVVVFEQSGHFPFVEEPDRFASVVGGWLAGLE